ncbi:MAG: prepilin-type N-terminal cleavage/methylation domain-containing protein [Candidatus Eisenbacteria bacterium]
MRSTLQPLGSKGLTLLELMIAVSITALIAVALSGFTRSLLQANAREGGTLSTYYDGLAAMERMSGAAKRATFLLIPNGYEPERDILALSGFINDDGDFYFGDSLFPRIDEDTDKDMVLNDVPGIKGVDDDGDGYIDTSGDKEDDDEDYWPYRLKNEENLNGRDDDGDGSIDEDLGEDMNGDNYSGIRGIDDDGDGNVDQMDKKDDDEDGQKNEDSLNPRWYRWYSGTGVLWEYTQTKTITESLPLCENVTKFRVQYQRESASLRTTLIIQMAVTGDDGRTYSFEEYVYPRNVDQHFGKRVR